eukprot:6218987-Heterocapsa_arctica.AAC.1
MPKSAQPHPHRGLVSPHQGLVALPSDASSLHLKGWPLPDQTKPGGRIFPAMGTASAGQDLGSREELLRPRWAPCGQELWARIRRKS